MDTGISTVRNLLYVVLVLVLLNLLSNFYVASQLSRNSDELSLMRSVLQKQLMGTALTQSQQLQDRMQALNDSAAGIDAKLQAAQDSFVKRMEVELPRIMDNYVKQRTPVMQRAVEQKLQQRGIPIKP
jgi:hypothetical protein